MRTLVLTTILTVLMVGCQDLTKLNEDPNNPTQPRTDLLLTEAEKAIGDRVGSVTGTLYVQYFSQTQYTDASTYSSINFSWDYWYTSPLTDLQKIIDLNTGKTADEPYVLAGGSNTNQLAVARILKAYFFHMVTDRWGPVPYKQALQGDEDLTPKYNSQKKIYMDLLSTLKTAASNIDPSLEAPTGDFLFDGNMNKWRKFANTLRMRLALRVSGPAPNTAKTHFMEAYNNGYLKESAMFPYLANATHENPWFSRFRTRTDYAISNTIANTMKKYDDMRLTKYAEPAPNYNDGDGVTELSDINPMPYGVSSDSAGSINNAEVSFPGMAIRRQDTPLPIISMAEIHFMLAEAAARGWGVSGSAKKHYMAGIKTSWKQWGVYNKSDFNTYMSYPKIQWDASKWKAKIGYQKWLALFPLGYEAWAEWRRLGFPKLKPAPDAKNPSGTIPVRQGYPSVEADLNSKNYKSAVNQYLNGNDMLNVFLWWDTTHDRTPTPGT